MNIAVIFAGGSGSRMTNSSKPKQFIELHGKPIIVYTIEHFETHPEIDAIIVVCIETWIGHMHNLVQNYNLTKVCSIVPGGATGQDSIWNGIHEAGRLFSSDSIVLIHDGVRPLINTELISANIRTASKNGNCITCVPAIETFVIKDDGDDLTIPLRKNSFLARAPQTFILKDITDAHLKAQSEERHDFIDSCMLMHHYGYKLSTIVGPIENIKITTPTDYFVFRALLHARENEQLYGL